MPQPQHKSHHQARSSLLKDSKASTSAPINSRVNGCSATAKTGVSSCVGATAAGDEAVKITAAHAHRPPILT